MSFLERPRRWYRRKKMMRYECPWCTASMLFGHGVPCEVPRKPCDVLFAKDFYDFLDAKVTTCPKWQALRGKGVERERALRSWGL